MRSLRYWFKARFAWWRVRIRSGPLQGHRIGIMCGMRFIEGRYDPSAMQALAEHLRPGATVYDIGAHVGYLTLFAAQRVGAAGRVVAFEPLPLNLRYLRAHLRANRADNVEVVAACVSDRGGTVGFEVGGGTGRGRLVSRAARGRRLPAICLDDEVLAGRLPAPDFVKVDVEGAEQRLLEGARQTLARNRPTLLLSVHSEALKQGCRQFLETLGYQVRVGAKPGELIALCPARDTLADPPDASPRQAASMAVA